MRISTFQDQGRELFSNEAGHLDGLAPLPPPFDADSKMNLQFPSLSDSRKRSARSSFAFPAKRRKSMPPEMERTASETEDNSWIDNFSLLDSILPDNTDFKTSGSSCADPLNSEDLTIKDIINKALDVSSREAFTVSQHSITPPLPLQPDHEIPSIDLGYYTAPKRCSFQEVASQPQLTPVIQPATNSAVVSPYLEPVESIPQHVPSLPQPIPAQPSYLSANGTELASSVNSDAFSISRLKNSSEPTLLTLTSYPFRVVYANEAFDNLSGEKPSMIGDSLFDIFKIEGSVLQPSLATYPTLAGRLENQTALVSTSKDGEENDSVVRCGVNAYPVNKRNDPNALRYFAIRFNQLEEVHH